MRGREITERLFCIIHRTFIATMITPPPCHYTKVLAPYCSACIADIGFQAPRVHHSPAGCGSHYRRTRLKPAGDRSRSDSYSRRLGKVSQRQPALHLQTGISNCWFIQWRRHWRVIRRERHQNLDFQSYGNILLWHILHRGHYYPRTCRGRGYSR